MLLFYQRNATQAKNSDRCSFVACCRCRTRTPMSAATRTPPTSASASTPLLSTPHRHTESAVLDERVAEHELLQLRLKLEQAISEVRTRRIARAYARRAHR